MSDVHPIPEGAEGVIPHLICKGAGEALEFYKNAFGAEEVMRMPGPDGRLMHAEIRIGGSLVFVADDHPEMCGGVERHPLALGGTPVTVHRYVTDCDASVNRAVEAGASMVMPPQDMFWGDRYGIVADPYGHQWSLATHTHDYTPEEMDANFQKMMAAGVEAPSE
ncbi:MAG: VOC family protein [Planctomycetota bacterium]|jgi:uncharacterized glyoxalase superfamily protein PhnB